MFELVPNLAKKDHVIDLKFCTVLFEDNAYYPWIFLVPCKDKVKNMTNLTMEERLQLMREMALCEEAMVELFHPSQTNVAMIDNKMLQLHVHIICRKEGDKSWPDIVWNKKFEPYKAAKKEEIISKIKKAIMIKMADGKYMQY